MINGIECNCDNEQTETGDFLLTDGGYLLVVESKKRAHDIVLLATSPKELQKLVCWIDKAVKECNMIINAAKIETLTNTNNALQTRLKRGILEQMDCCLYLGSKIRKDAECKSKVKTRLSMGTSIMSKLTKLLNNKPIDIFPQN